MNVTCGQVNIVLSWYRTSFAIAFAIFTRAAPTAKGSRPDGRELLSGTSGAGGGTLELLPDWSLGTGGRICGACRGTFSQGATLTGVTAASPAISAGSFDGSAEL